MRRCARCASLVMPPVGCIRHATVQQISAANGRWAQLKDLTGPVLVIVTVSPLCFRLKRTT